MLKRSYKQNSLIGYEVKKKRGNGNSTNGSSAYGVDETAASKISQHGRDELRKVHASYTFVYCLISLIARERDVLRWDVGFHMAHQRCIKESCRLRTCFSLSVLIERG
jgi:hypothetical protein